MTRSSGQPKRDERGDPRHPRLLAFVQLPPPVHGVTRMNEVVVRSALIHRDYDLSVLELRFADQIRDLGRLRVSKLFRGLELGLRLLLHCIRSRPQLVYFTFVPTGPAFFRDLFYVWIMKGMGTKRVLHLHGLGIARSSVNPVVRYLYRWVFRGAFVVHLSEAGRSDVANVIGRSPCLLLPNGVDDLGREEWLVERRLREGSPRILFLSNMLEEKGGLVLLEALARLATQGVEFQAHFVGSECDVQWESRFLRMRAERGLERQVDRCSDCAGFAKQEAFRHADLFVFPSYYQCECFPLVVLEAMASGLPVVAARHASIPEIVVDGGTGLLVQPRSVDPLATAIARLLRDPDLRIRMGTAGRARYLANYTTAIFESRLSRILREAAGAPIAIPDAAAHGAAVPSDEPEPSMVSSR